MGDQWELYNQGYIGGPMRWGTNAQGRKGYKGGGDNEKGDQWELCNQDYIGGPMRDGEPMRTG